MKPLWLQAFVDWHELEKLANTGIQRARGWSKGRVIDHCEQFPFHGVRDPCMVASVSNLGEKSYGEIVLGLIKPYQIYHDTTVDENLHLRRAELGAGR